MATGALEIKFIGIDEFTENMRKAALIFEVLRKKFWVFGDVMTTQMKLIAKQRRRDRYYRTYKTRGERMRRAR